MKGCNVSIIQKITEVLDDLNYLENPYFTSLHNGNFDKDDFVETQIQFYYAVTFFSRPMAALAAKIPLPKMRLEIVRNVWEEHGEGDLKKAHTHTFEELLKRLANISVEDIQRRALWPEVRLFNTALIGISVLDDYMTGIGVMGIIEHMFSSISHKIGSGIIKRGWLNNETIIHYDVHEKLDVKHSKDFFDIVEETYQTSAENRYYIDQGIWIGATLFNSVYKQLYENRKRRIFRDLAIPHSRAEGIPC
jgi:pyrroloquinoline-quinone synthase